MRSIQTMFWRSAVMCVLAAVSACGSSGEADLYKVRRAAERGAPPEKIAELLSGVDAFAPDFSAAVHRSLFFVKRLDGRVAGRFGTAARGGRRDASH